MCQKVIVMLLSMCLFFPPLLSADECMEGDCDDGFGTGFTEDNKIYEGQWENGMPHGPGKLYISKDHVIEGVFEKGVLVQKDKAVVPEEKNGK